MIKALSAEEVKICELMNVNPHTYIEARESERSQALNAETRSIKEIEDEISRLMGISPAQKAEAKKRVEKETIARAPLTSDELEVCHAMGVEPMNYWATKMADAGLKPKL